MSSGKDSAVDVAIVGGGIAGLIAGRDLARAGLSALVLEAKDRLGGRAFYRDSKLGMKLEIGGGFVHWLQPHLWAEMLAYGLEIESVAWIEHGYWLDKGEVRKMPIMDLMGAMTPGEIRIAEGALEAFPNPHAPFPLTDAARRADRMTVAQRLAELDLCDEERRMVAAHWTLSFNGPMEDAAWSQILRLVALAGGDWKMRGQAESRYVLKGGTSMLIDAILAESGAEHRLNAHVISIVQEEKGAALSLADGSTVRAREVIVTVPMPVVHDMAFDPPLSARKVAASRRNQVSQGVKVWMRAKGKIDGFIAFAPEDYPLTMMGTEYDVDDDTILLAFGPRSSDLDIRDVAAVQAAARQWLPDLELVAVDGHDWSADPLCRETWAMLRTGQLEDIEEFNRPEGHVRFAGGDIALGWAGHFDGAIESARRAARDIARKLSAQGGS